MSKKVKQEVDEQLNKLRQLFEKAMQKKIDDDMALWYAVTNKDIKNA